MQIAEIENKILITLATTQKDKKACSELINRVFLAQQLVARKDRKIIPANQMDKELSGKGKEVFMVRSKETGAVIATVLLVLSHFFLMRSADICYLAVDPSWQGLGLGKIVMDYAENRARQLGIKKIQLTVVCHPKHSSQALINWYLDQNYVCLRDLKATKEQCLKWFELPYHDAVYFKLLEKKLS